MEGYFSSLSSLIQNYYYSTTETSLVVWLFSLSVMMFFSFPIFIYLFFPSLQVTGFRELFRHYILRIPDPDRSWMQDEQFVESYGNLYQHIHLPSNQCRLKEEEEDADVTHFLFLMHGVNGYALDLSYPEMMLKLFRDEKILQLIGNQQNSTTAAVQQRNQQPTPKRQYLVVHAATSNERKTKDGIVKGGKRLNEEMSQVITHEMKKKNKRKNSTNTIKPEITISMFGNSLGGLYCRFAIAEFMKENNPLMSKYTVKLNVFLTTATPHLGVSKQTYFPLPRTAEIGLAHTMGETGRDLFQLNDLLKRMATESKYISSLKGFRKRIAYANAYGTDFPVPTATAAFLHERSTYPHHHIPSEEDDCFVLDEKGLVIAKLHTHPVDDNEQKYSSSDDDDEEECTDDLLLMSNSLDSLGWKKVFVDLRHEIPIGVELPKSFSPKKEITEQKLVQRMESKEVASATKHNGSNRIIYPLGHNMIVAVSRCDKSASFNSGGRPVIDALAKEVVELIFSP